MATKKSMKKAKPVANKIAPKATKGKVVKLKPVKSKVKTPKAIEKKPTPKKLDKVTKIFTKGELYSTLADRTELSRKQIVSVFDSLTEVIAAHLKKDGPEKFVLPGLLKIVVKKVPARPARDGINPFTGEPTTFAAKPASKKVKVIALRALKDLC